MIFTPCEEEAYAEFPGLIYSRNDAGKLYFDATYCLDHTTSEDELGIDDFMGKFSFEIGALRNGFQIAEEEFIVENSDNGHRMIAECAEFLFLSYIDRWLIPYFYLRLREMFVFGFTMSDGFLQGAYTDRFGGED